jgi:MFS family permease
MTSLSPDPLIVSLVQVAASLPIFLLAIPAGALADIIDRRRFLIIGEAANTVIAAVFAVLVSLNLVTAAVLLLFTFLISAFGAFTAPAWQAVPPQLVPKEDLPAAIAANSIGFNVSRATGPALGGASPHSASRRRSGSMRRAISVINGGLIWWHPPRAHHPPAKPAACRRRRGPAPPPAAMRRRAVMFFCVNRLHEKVDGLMTGRNSVLERSGAWRCMTQTPVCFARG